jgi:hypothetical protein
VDLGGACERLRECGLERILACNLAADVADETAKPCAQDAQFATVAVELFGMGVTPRHHGGTLGDAHVGLSQAHPVLAHQAVQSLDRRVQELRVGREGHVLGLHRGVDRDPGQILAPQSPALMCHSQALGQKRLQLVTEPLPPVAQVRALVRERVLEKLLPGEVLEVRIKDPALAHAFVREPVNVLEQQQPDREARLDPGPSLVAVERRDLAVDPLPVQPTGELHQLILHVDDLVQPRAEQIA